jgi:hypothetical protein
MLVNSAQFGRDEAKVQSNKGYAKWNLYNKEITV